MTSGEKNPAARPLYRPPRDWSRRRLPALAKPPPAWYRLHWKDAAADAFSCRPVHRFSHPQSGVQWLYLGEDFATCACEVFGDTLREQDGRLSRARWLDSRFSRLTLREDLHLLDFTEAHTLRAAGVDTSALTHPDLNIPQAWGRAVAAHPAGFDGFLYASRFGRGRCLALLRREGAPAPVRRRGRGRVLRNLPAANAFLTDFHVRLV